MTPIKRAEKINDGLNTLIKNNSDIKSLISIGSFSVGAFDEFSDIDLYLLTTNTDKYLTDLDNSWIQPLGRVLSRKIYKDSRENVNKNKVIMDGGLMYDITIISLKRFQIIKYYLFLNKYKMTGLIPEFIKKGIVGNISKFRQTIYRGYKIHHDLAGIRKTLEESLKVSVPDLSIPISKTRFMDSYNFFWQSCYTASVKLIRGEFYHVILLYDHFMKYELLRMMEWAVSLENSSTDTFYNGVKLDKWGGKLIYEKLLDSLLRDNVLEMQSHLLKTADIFHHYTSQVAKALALNVDMEFEKFVIDFINNSAIPNTNPDR